MKFDEIHSEPDPFLQFKKWYGERLAAVTVYPEAMTLASADRTGMVSARIVLLKSFDRQGFVFFTNYKSRKGIQIKDNPAAALLFFWPESGRQIRVEGVIEKLSERESDEYFESRPRESQTGAWASEQSSVIPDRRYLEERFSYYAELFNGRKVPRPEHWGGFRLNPGSVEFWQEGSHRLHDRIIYSLNKGTWEKKRLSP